MRSLEKFVRDSQNTWVNTLCAREYDRLIKHISLTVAGEKPSILADFLTDIKVHTMNLRRLTAFSSGILLGAVISIAPDLISSTAGLIGVGAFTVLGLNIAVDQVLNLSINSRRKSD